MKLPIGSSRDFIPAPEGRHRAVCVDVADLGMVETSFGDKHKLRIVWEIDKLMQPDEESGERRRFIVTNRYTASLHEKANLHQDIVCWLGRDFTEEEQVDGYDLEQLIGKPCWLQIVHKQGTYQGKPTTFANIANIISLVDGEEPLAPSGSYMRLRDREGSDGKPAPNVSHYGVEEDETSAGSGCSSDEGEDPDIPF